MRIRQTHTYAILPVSRSAFEEIKSKLTEAGYEHVFDEDGNVIDMNGLALMDEQKFEESEKKGD